MTKFLNRISLTTLLNQLHSIFATASEVAEVEADTDMYVLNIDYDKYLKFDTNLIISNDNSSSFDSLSSLLDVGLLDVMILAE